MPTSPLRDELEDSANDPSSPTCHIFNTILVVPPGGTRFNASDHDQGMVTTNVMSDEDFAKFNPFERVILHAQGNLQAMASAWFAAPIVVTLVQNDDVSGDGDGGFLFDRKVRLMIDGKRLFADAHSAVHLTSRPLYEDVKGGKIGLGQLFRSMNVLPRFTLLAAGHKEDGCLWRMYELRAAGIATRILETFPAEVLKMA